MRSASFCFLFIVMMLSAQAQAFDEGGLAYTITSSTSPFTVEVTGRASGNSATDINIPDTVTSNGTTYSVTTIGDWAFSYTNLSSLTIGNNVTTIGYAAFAFNDLNSLTIPDSVTTIGDQAFTFNNTLTSLTIGSSVTTIGNWAFYDNDLSSVTFLGDFGAFNLNMFEDNFNLTAITYVQGKSGWPQTFTPAGSGNVAATNTFEQGDLAYLITSGTTVEVTGRASGSAATDINIPDTVTSNGITYSVTTIADSAFVFESLTSVTIGNSVTTIGNYAFASTRLTSVTIGNSVTTIGIQAFNSNNLISLTLPDSVTTIEGNAFSNNDLASVNFLGNRGTFNLNIFYGNANLILITYVQGKTDWPATFTLGVSGSVDAIPSTFEQGDLAYLITSATTVEVTGRASGNSSTEITIPDAVTSNGTTYSVTTIGENAFGVNALNSVTIGNSVTTIGVAAFAGNELTSVTIGNSVTTIGDFAFYNNDLISLTIPDSVTTIGNWAFDTNNLTSVNFLGNFGAFNPNMFTGNSNLTTITYVQGKTDWPATFTLGASGSVDAIPSTFEQGDLAYLITSATTVEVTGRALGSVVTDINIPDTVTSNGITYSVTTIADFAFLFKFLTSVTIGNSVKTIGNLAFYDNDLISLTIPDSVTTIGNLAFTFNELNSLTIPDSVTTIGHRAFDTNNLTSVNFLGNFGAFNLNMFTGNSNLTTITYVQGKTGWPATFTLGVSGSVDAIPSTFEHADLAYLITSATTVEVAGRASGSAATDINIPDTVTSNGTTYSVTTIADSAFVFKFLTSVTIGNSVKTIGNAAFASTGLTSVTIGNSVTTIGNSAFYGNTLTSVTIPNSVTTIEDFAFQYNSLTSVTIPNSVTTIGNKAFANNSLTSVTFLGDFGAFNLNMFEDNFNLTAITYVQGKSGWPQTFTPAGSGNVAATNTFEHANLAYLITSGTTVEVTGWASGSAATDINIPDTVTSNGITYSVTTIADSAFVFKSLTSVTIGNSVTTIGNYAFASTGLTSVTIGNSVTTIEGNAFSNNDLASVNFLGNFGAFNPNMFTGNSNLTTITYVQGKAGWPQTFTPAGSGSVTTTSLPTTPQITYIESDDQKVLIRVSVASNGGSSITRYDATCSDGTNSFAGTSSSSLITVSGLTNGVAYTCTVTATNGVGTSTASSASAATPEEIIPSGLPIWLLYEATQSG